MRRFLSRTDTGTLVKPLAELEASDVAHLLCIVNPKSARRAHGAPVPSRWDEASAAQPLRAAYMNPVLCTAVVDMWLGSS